ncbi:MAG TPA: DegT/DnrJ/EryC1/StrS family aminotransferase, partial [Gemmatimonadales bacterium]|nr:DegT/DnrJ/EryC1/StrS family aminotransferase [Gemmatimonadales bacterium]
WPDADDHSSEGWELVVNVPLLDLMAQYVTIKDEVLPAVTGVIESQQFIMGPAVAQLEVALARLCGARHGIGCASGTDALLLPLKTLGLRPGDEVITTAFTFFASGGTIHNAGGTPVFVDIEPDTLNIDPAAVEAAVTPRTRALLPVHLYGQMAKVERLLEIAAKRGVPLIEDACQAIGARRQVAGAWRMAGELGWVGAYSFFPSKNLGGWGDGGMIVTSDGATAERLRKLRLHGGAKQYHHDEVGTNSRLDTLQAAVLLAKLPHLAAWSAKRREHAAYYTQALAGLPAVRPLVVAAGNEHIFHQYTVRVERRDELQAHLKAKGIGHAVYYPVPLHRQPCFASLGYREGSLPVTERAAREVISLPIYPELTRAQLDAVVAAIREFYR